MQNHMILKSDANNPKPSDSMVKSEELITPNDMTMVIGRKQSVLISSRSEYYRLLSLGHPEFSTNDLFTRTINCFAITIPSEIFAKRIEEDPEALQF